MYVIVGLLYFPVGALLAWRAYRQVVGHALRCQYDRAERKLKLDHLVMTGLICVWLLVFSQIVMD